MQKVNPESKIYHDWAEGLKKIDSWKQKGLEITFTNGCFDLLHYGHVQYLYDASQMADKLIVGINSDRSVTRIKGNDRPIQDEKSRATILASLETVDLVIIFDENTPLQLIKYIRPDILVKGADYENKEIVGQEFVESIGGITVLIPFEKGYSTTKIIKKIKS